jgi:hypothetical protein
MMMTTAAAVAGNSSPHGPIMNAIIGYLHGHTKGKTKDEGGKSGHFCPPNMTHNYSCAS